MIEKIKKIFDTAATYFDDSSGQPMAQSSFGKVAGLTTIYSPQEETKNTGGGSVRDVADALVAIGRLTNDELATVRGEQFKNTGESTAQILLRLGYVDRDDILAAKSHIYGLEFRHLKIPQIDHKVFEKLDAEFVMSNRIVPIAFEDNILTVATCEPENVFLR